MVLKSSRRECTLRFWMFLGGAVAACSFGGVSGRFQDLLQVVLIMVMRNGPTYLYVSGTFSIWCHTKAT